MRLMGLALRWYPRLAVVVGAAAALAASSPARPDASPLRALVGQTIMTAFEGTTLDNYLLGRIRRGEVGGLIVYGNNYRSDAQLRALVTAAQGAARAGGNPPLLIAADQEGGPVRRIPHAPAL